MVKRDLLSHDSDLLGSIDCLAAPEEVLVTHAVRVEVTTILVADAAIAVVSITALSARAAVETLIATDVGGVGSGFRVSFPDVHLRAACSISAIASVGISCRGGPVENVGLVNTR